MPLQKAISFLLLANLVAINLSTVTGFRHHFKVAKSHSFNGLNFNSTNVNKHAQKFNKRHSDNVNFKAKHLIQVPQIQNQPDPNSSESFLFHDTPFCDCKRHCIPINPPPSPGSSKLKSNSDSLDLHRCVSKVDFQLPGTASGIEDRGCFLTAAFSSIQPDIINFTEDIDSEKLILPDIFCHNLCIPIPIPKSGLVDDELNPNYSTIDSKDTCRILDSLDLSTNPSGIKFHQKMRKLRSEIEGGKKPYPLTDSESKLDADWIQSQVSKSMAEEMRRKEAEKEGSKEGKKDSEKKENKKDSTESKRYNNKYGYVYNDDTDDVSGHNHGSNLSHLTEVQSDSIADYIVKNMGNVMEGVSNAVAENVVGVKSRHTIDDGNRLSI